MPKEISAFPLKLNAGETIALDHGKYLPGSGHSNDTLVWQAPSEFLFQLEEDS